MAARLRKFGVTTVGACAGAALAAWAINANDSPYKVVVVVYVLWMGFQTFQQIKTFVNDCFVCQ